MAVCAKSHPCCLVRSQPRRISKVLETRRPFAMFLFVSILFASASKITCRPKQWFASAVSTMFPSKKFVLEANTGIDMPYSLSPKFIYKYVRLKEKGRKKFTTAPNILGRWQYVPPYNQTLAVLKAINITAAAPPGHKTLYTQNALEWFINKHPADNILNASAIAACNRTWRFGNGTTRNGQ